MKLRIGYCCMTMFVLLCGCDEHESSSSGNDTAWRVEVVSSAEKEEKEKLSRELEDAKERLRKQEKELLETQRQVKDISKKAEDNRSDTLFWMWTAIGIIGGLVIVVVLLCVAGNRKPRFTVNREEDGPRCPRCGWKYVMGDIKCKNCGTRF